MKKQCKKVMGMLMALVAAAVASFTTACGKTDYGDDNSSHDDKTVDNTKTQIQVWTYQAGFGDEWLWQLEEAFEEKYADAVFEEGKKGVQVHHMGEKKELLPNDIKNGSFDVYFMENADYYTLKNDGETLEDLTDIVNAVSPIDNKTIASKMDSQQKLFFGGAEDEEEATYYGIPHYKGSYGIIYNIELFDSKGYYFTDVTGTRLIRNNTSLTKSVGPDGIEGIDDDGLPATYAQFTALCTAIANSGDIPLCWPGKYYELHLANFYNALVAEYEGVDSMNLNLTFTGTADDLVRIENNSVVKNGDALVTESLDITTGKGYEVMRQAGKYYALDLLRTIMTAANYRNADAYTTSYSHTDNQQDFVEAGTDYAGTESIAMMVDGSWWEQEATSVFNRMQKSDEKYSKQNRRFGWMPLPKANTDEIGSTNLFLNTLNAMCGVKKGLSEGKKNAALAFVQYCCSDEALVTFTQVTGATKDFNYTLTEEEKSVLSPYAKSLLNYVENSTTYALTSGNAFYLKNRSGFLPMYLNSMVVDGTTYTNPAIAIHEKNASTDALFTGMYKYWSGRTIWE